MVSFPLPGDLNLPMGSLLLFLREPTRHNQHMCCLKEAKQPITVSTNPGTNFSKIFGSCELFQIVIWHPIEPFYKTQHPGNLPGILVRERIQKFFRWTRSPVGSVELNRSHRRS
jgi:hypothetical protein